MTRLVAFLVQIAVVLLLTSPTSAEVQTFSGASDASAAIPYGKDSILVADDENNCLRGYAIARAGAPTCTLDLTASLSVDPRHPEVDIEGAARVGHRVYWISSHGRSREGKPRPSRHRFFATRIAEADEGVSATLEGIVCDTMTDALGDLKEADVPGLARAIGSMDGRRDQLAPKREGLNIEGLCATPGGETLYLGFRNPRPEGRALVLPLINPEAVIERGDRPRFGEPLRWDLGNRGVRAMTYSPHHLAFFVVAGPHDDRAGFVLYRWSGDALAPPRLIRSLDNVAPEFKAESLIAFADRADLYLLSDDGSRLVSVSGPQDCLPGQWLAGNRCQNKHLLDASRKTFRGTWLAVE